MQTRRYRFLLVAIAMTVVTGAAGVRRGAGRTQQAPYAAWKHGPPASPNYFPIAVWLQDPKDAALYQAAGFDLYVGLWQGPTEAQLAALKAAGMPVFCEQNAVGLAHRDDPIIQGWLQGDEPDNAQPLASADGKSQGYGPCIPPTKVVAEYERLRAADPTRPVLLNLGQGVANDAWVGRGPGASLNDYRSYVQGGDIVSFDVYPIAGLDTPDRENDLWYVAKGVTRLVHWTEGGKPVWNCIECTRISGERKATPRQVRAEVWMALIHGSRGLVYFVHQFKPTFDEHALLDDPEMLKAVTAINRQIHALAPVLNSPTIRDGAAVVRSSSPQVPIATMEKRVGGATYLFAAGMHNGPAHATFTVPGRSKKGTVEVLGESRAIPLRNGQFADDFQPYDVHLYQMN
ncbi:MAG TPA: hypothetical protein VKU00_30505 [Chthonomonadaceae bacterium]|nr:hypothetical protein [Chthonomonadaceae bacterium]